MDYVIYSQKQFLLLMDVVLDMHVFLVEKMHSTGKPNKKGLPSTCAVASLGTLGLLGFHLPLCIFSEENQLLDVLISSATKDRGFNPALSSLNKTVL